MSKITDGPWKVIVAGNQFGIARARAKRGDDDICMGSQFHPDWRANAAAIAAIPEMLAALELTLPLLTDDAARATVKAALRKANAKVTGGVA